MGPDVPLDTILKKFTIVYGNVKSFDLLMRDFLQGRSKGRGVNPFLCYQNGGTFVPNQRQVP